MGGRPYTKVVLGADDPQTLGAEIERRRSATPG